MDKNGLNWMKLSHGDSFSRPSLPGAIKEKHAHLNYLSNMLYQTCRNFQILVVDFQQAQSSESNFMHEVVETSCMQVVVQKGPCGPVKTAPWTKETDSFWNSLSWNRL